MKAILTKYHGPTNTKGSRLSATAEGGNRIYVGRNCELSIEDNHAAAARQLKLKMNWPGDMVGGTLPDGSMAWVYQNDHAL